MKNVECMWIQGGHQIARNKNVCARGEQKVPRGGCYDISVWLL